MFVNKKSFTLVELIIVTVIMWILAMATTVYLWWTDEKRKIIEGQWCATSIWGEINNYIFYALTSKKLKISDDDTVSPNFYIIQFTWWNCSLTNWCDTINLLYSTTDNTTETETYKSFTIQSKCSNNKPNIKLYWTWINDVKYVVMNKWFLPRSTSNFEVFYLEKTWGSYNKAMTWDMIIWLCFNKDCSTPKEIWKFAVDARSQTISIVNCKYYENDDPTKCKTRDGCSVYNSEDPTICEKY